MTDTDRITRLERGWADLGGMVLSQQREITRLKQELHDARIDASLDVKLAAWSWPVGTG